MTPKQMMENPNSNLEYGVDIKLHNKLQVVEVLSGTAWVQDELM